MALSFDCTLVDLAQHDAASISAFVGRQVVSWTEATVHHALGGRQTVVAICNRKLLVFDASLAALAFEADASPLLARIAAVGANSAHTFVLAGASDTAGIAFCHGDGRRYATMVTAGVSTCAIVHPANASDGDDMPFSRLDHDPETSVLQTLETVLGLGFDALLKAPATLYRDVSAAVRPAVSASVRPAVSASELVAAIARRMDMPESAVSWFGAELSTAAHEAMHRQESFAIPGLMSFRPKTRPARPGATGHGPLNPAADADVLVPETTRMIVKTQPSFRTQLASETCASDISPDAPALDLLAKAARAATAPAEIRTRVRGLFTRHAKAQRLTHAFFEALATAIHAFVRAGAPHIELFGLGTLHVEHTPEIIGTHPTSGVPLHVPARTDLVFVVTPQVLAVAMPENVEVQ